MGEQSIIPSQVGPAGAGSIRVPGMQSDPSQNWGAIAQAARAVLGIRNGSQLTADQINALKQGGFLLLDRPHPFKIYNVPDVLLATPDDATDWLRFRVRSGRVGDLDVTGTDDVINPDSDEVPTDGTGDIAITSGSDAFYFWIELSKPAGVFTATIKSGEDPNSNGWDDYPETDGRFMLIGWVDTTDTVGKQVVIRQILRADIPKGIETTDCSAGGDSIVDYFGYRFDTPA